MLIWINSAFFAQLAGRPSRMEGIKFRGRRAMFQSRRYAERVDVFRFASNTRHWDAVGTSLLCHVWTAHAAQQMAFLLDQFVGSAT
jgi:hypothetical protein